MLPSPHGRGAGGEVGVWCGAFCFWPGPFVGLARAFCLWPGLFVGLSEGFVWGDEVPPRPPKCAHLGAFHEVVSLGVVVFGLGFLSVWVRAFCFL